MNQYNYSWSSLFNIATLLLLMSIPFGYFLGSLAFGIWFSICVLWGYFEKHFKLKRVLLPLLVFTLFSFITIIWTQDTERTLHAIGRQLPLLLFPVAGMFLPPISRTHITKILKQYSVFLCFLIVVLILIASFKYTKYQYKDFLFYHELVAPLELNAIYISYIVSTVFLFLLSTLKDAQSMYALVLLLLGVFLLMLSSKMIIVITVILAAAILFFKLKGKLLRFSGLGLIILAILAIMKFAKPIQNRFTTEFNTSFSQILNAPSFEKGRAYTGLEARVLQIRVFNEIVDEPSEYLIGVGLASTNRQITKIHERLNTPEAFHHYNFHNQYLQVFAELGLVGLITLVIVLVIGFKKSIKYKSLFPFIIITIALFFSESVIWRQRGIMFFGIVYILLMSSKHYYEGKKSISEV